MYVGREKRTSKAIRLNVQEHGIEVGHAYLYLIYNDLREVPYGLLEDVYVKEEFRGKRIGSSLVQAVIKEAREHCCYKLIAQSRHSREHVHKLYVKLGFIDHGKNFRMNF